MERLNVLIARSALGVSLSGIRKLFHEANKKHGDGFISVGDVKNADIMILVPNPKGIHAEGFYVNRVLLSMINTVGKEDTVFITNQEVTPGNMTVAPIKEIQLLPEEEQQPLGADGRTAKIILGNSIPLVRFIDGMAINGRECVSGGGWTKFWESKGSSIPQGKYEVKMVDHGRWSSKEGSLAQTLQRSGRVDRSQFAFSSFENLERELLKDKLEILPYHIHTGNHWDSLVEKWLTTNDALGVMITPSRGLGKSRFMQDWEQQSDIALAMGKAIHAQYLNGVDPFDAPTFENAFWNLGDAKRTIVIRKEAEREQEKLLKFAENYGAKGFYEDFEMAELRHGFGKTHEAPYQSLIKKYPLPPDECYDPLLMAAWTK